MAFAQSRRFLRVCFPRRTTKTAIEVEAGGFQAQNLDPASNLLSQVFIPPSNSLKKAPPKRGKALRLVFLACLSDCEQALEV